MSAFGKSRNSHAPYVVEELLRELHVVYNQTKDGRLRPNIRSFNTCVSVSLQMEPTILVLRRK